MSEEKVILPSIKSIPASSWEKLAQKKIYFGHQSVGFNIIDGIRDVMKEYPEIKLEIIETSDIADFKGDVFAHSRVGKNTDPKSKIDAFTDYLDSGFGTNADLVTLKFCYVDVTADTQIIEVLNNYTSNMDKIKKRFPKIKIIHLTVPLTRSKTSWKTIVKKLIGRKTWEYDDNIKRNEYNELLIKKYEGKVPVFDLAKIESTYPDGSRSFFEKDGRIYYSLVPEYTHDGGHLNEKGRKIVAEQLLTFLAALCK